MKRIIIAGDGVTVANVEAIAGDAEPDEAAIDVADGCYVGPGFTWNGSRKAPAFAPPAPAPDPVPQEVTNRQMRLALLALGKLDDADTIVQGMPLSVKIEWEYANVVYRDAALINGAAQLLGMSSDEVDGLFRYAAAL